MQPSRAAVRALSGVAAAVFGLLVVLAAPSRAQAEDLLVFAAASLKDALDAALVEYQAAGGAPVKVSYASSSTLARQIEGARRPTSSSLPTRSGWTTCRSAT
jgi:molybdate transport system substrate-binding protein